MFMLVLTNQLDFRLVNWHKKCPLQIITESWVNLHLYCSCRFLGYKDNFLTWLTRSFQSLISMIPFLLLSSYSVRVNTAPAPHRSSSLMASRIVTSPWARWFNSFRASAFLMISSLALRTWPKFSFSRVVPFGMWSRRKSSIQWSWERGSPRTHFSTGSTFCPCPNNSQLTEFKPYLLHPTFIY